MKRKTLTTAIVAGLTGVAGMIGVASAVNVNPEGLGQVLIYPYYTARAGNDTLISVVNTSSQAKAAKVRFLEGLNSREVLDFNLYLSAFDVWTGAITENEEGDGARLLVGDSTCTVPYIFGEGGEQQFLDFNFTGEEADGGTTALERVESGYLEILDMGTVFGERREFATNTITGETIFIGFSDPDVDGPVIPLASNPFVAASGFDPSIVAANSSRPVVSLTGSEYALTHVDTEVEEETVSRPRDCQQLVNAWTISNALSPLVTYWTSLGPETDIAAPEGAGTLFGSSSIINVNEGTLFSYDAEAIDNWRNASFHSNPSVAQPFVISTDQNTSAVFQSGSQSVSQVAWDPNRIQDPVNAVLTKETVLNEYNVAAGVNAETEWVFTFPTKRFHVDREILPFIPATGPTGNVVGSDGEPVFVTEECAAVSSFTTGQALTPSEIFDPVFDEDTGEPACIAVFEQIAFIQPPRAPFGSTFDGTACEPYGFTAYNREEVGPRGGAFVIPPIVSPPPPSPDPELQFPALCFETNVVQFTGDEEPGEASNIFGEPRFTTFPLADRFPNGWVEFSFARDTIPGTDFGGNPNFGSNPLGFPEDAREITGEDNATGLPVVYEGLPVVGFGAQKFSNSTLEVDGQAVLSNYGGTFQHRGTRNIRAPRDD